MDNIIQGLVMVLTTASVLFSQQANEELKRYACLAGLAAQPIWVHIALETGQWGVLGLTVVITATWLLGFYNYWIKKT